MKPAPDVRIAIIDSTAGTPPPWRSGHAECRRNAPRRHHPAGAGVGRRDFSMRGQAGFANGTIAHDPPGTPPARPAGAREAAD